METWVLAVLLVACVIGCPLWVRICLANLRRWSAAGVVSQRTGNVSRDTQPVRFYYILAMMALGAVLPLVVTIALTVRLIFE
ncbi:hypothetical protein B5V02_16700 [Mesorhizobium kowhaii]|jgi:hypothetical protein|uniref:Uncharacterized protein n=1 Tax=Mesorhizobium kowhaii TaxID=1300272 RepID=A0A2W7CMZ8_9HYPH|nr:hypothetical protein B5V02_16700 [Mesorhizobium kowhaii]